MEVGHRDSGLRGGGITRDPGDAGARAAGPTRGGDGERRIRNGTDQLWKQAGFRPGPDTDLLGGDNRGDAKSRRHFSPLGQKRAALLWFAVLWSELQQDEESR